MGHCTDLLSSICLGSLLTWGAYAAPGAVAQAEMSGKAPMTASAVAQLPSDPNSYTVIHVNAASGNDAQADGSQLRPYQTISRALELASPQTLILLAGGTYSADSGESFPLQLRSGVTIQGMAGPNAADVLIRGNGHFYSGSRGMQQVTILSANNAGLANVTVSNPHPEGTGMWIESGSPIILNNAFFQNGANGIYIAGTGQPVIRGNYFAENGQAGLVIAGPSTAKVESNIFENTGAGITLAPDSAPEILDNRISSNLDGLIMHAEARPTLRRNQIVHNRRNSIVDYAEWMTIPNSDNMGAIQPPPTRQATTISPASETGVPGTSSVPEVAEPVATAPGLPGVNSRVNETVPDLAVDVPPAITTPAPEIADTSGTQLEPTHSEVATVTGTADLSTPTTAVTDDARGDTQFNGITGGLDGDRLPQQLSATAMALTDVDVDFITAIASEPLLATVDLSPLRTVPVALEPLTQTTAATTSNFFAPLPEPGASVDGETETSELSASPEAIEIPVIPPPNQAIAKPEPVNEALEQAVTQALSTADALPNLPSVAPSETEAVTAPERLSVPSLEIPMGSGGSLPELFVTGAVETASSDDPPPPPSLASSLGLRYKVLVTAPDEATQSAVRTQVPDAFRTQLNGQVYMQAGAYPTRDEAQAQVNQLLQAGLQAQIQELPN